MLCLFLIGQFEAIAQAFPVSTTKVQVSNSKKTLNSVIIYSSNKYSGVNIHLKPGAYPNPKAFPSIGDNNVSSIYLTKDFIGIVYEHTNFKGRYQVITEATPQLKHFDNQVSSIKIFKVPETKEAVALFFGEPGFKGYKHALKTGIYPMAKSWHKLGDDAVSSIRVKPGYQVILFEKTNFQGRMIAYTKNAPSLRPNKFDNQTSSALLVHAHKVKSPPIKEISPKND